VSGATMYQRCISSPDTSPYQLLPFRPGESEKDELRRYALTRADTTRTRRIRSTDQKVRGSSPFERANVQSRRWGAFDDPRTLSAASETFRDSVRREKPVTTVWCAHPLLRPACSERRHAQPLRAGQPTATITRAERATSRSGTGDASTKGRRACASP
jgi:hypothetical protein